MGDKEEEKTISILVKNASSRFADVPLSIPLSWTVFQLKEELIKHYEGNPSVQQLKLIFGGQLLNNDSTFNQIFVNSNQSITQNIYLVISSNQSNTNPSSTSPNSLQGQVQFRFQARLQQQQEENNNNNPIRPQERAQEPQRQEERANREGDGTFWTFLKLAFMVYILSQGGGNARFAILCWIALVIFLVQTGRLRMFTQIPFNLPHLPSSGVAIAQNSAQQPKTWFQEIEQLVVPFFCSLFPNWQLPTQQQPQQEQPQQPEEHVEREQ